MRKKRKRSRAELAPVRDSSEYHTFENDLFFIYLHFTNLNFMVPSANFDSDWSAFKRGDRQAFAKIYHENVNGLLKYGYQMYHNKALVEDCLQDLFIELWKSRNTVSETTSVKFYLFQAIRYKIRRKITEAARIEMTALDNGEHLPMSSIESDLIELEISSEQMNHLKELVNTLPARQKEALNLRFYNNFSNEEIAQIMGVNYKSACRFIYLALEKLKTNLKISVS